MTAPKIPPEDFIRLYEELGATGLAAKFGLNIRTVQRKRASMEGREGRQLKSPTRPDILLPEKPEHPGRLSVNIHDGVVLIGSDSHYWPGIISPAHRAFVKFCKTLKPKVVIKNGDELDGATISRHPPIGWEKRPSLIEEIETVKDRLGEITIAAGGARRFWPLGNHDARFETRLATVAPEFARVHGVHLKDHFPDWEPCWAVWINDSVVVKHRFKSGIHAPHNNTMWAGKTIVTGHLHSLKTMPITDYNGTRWGVDCGTLADPYGPQFSDYTEDSPRSWRSGFAVLTFREGRLLWPEVCHVVDEETVDFRGELIKV
jgi:hypothetical protein